MTTTANTEQNHDWIPVEPSQTLSERTIEQCNCGAWRDTHPMGDYMASFVYPADPGSYCYLVVRAGGAT